MRGTWVSIRGHEIRSAKLASGEPVVVAAGEEVVVQGLSDDQYFGDWRGGRAAGGAGAGGKGVVTMGISLQAVGEVVKEVRGWVGWGLRRVAAGCGWLQVVARGLSLCCVQVATELPMIDHEPHTTDTTINTINAATDPVNATAIRGTPSWLTTAT